MTFLQNFMVGLIVFSVAFVGVLAVFQQTTNTYNVPISQNFSKSYNVINDTLTKSEIIAESVYNSSSTEENTFFQKATGSLKAIGIAMFSSWKFAKAIMMDVANVLGVPAFFVGALISIIILTLAFAMIRMVFSKV